MSCARWNSFLVSVTIVAGLGLDDAGIAFDPFKGS
jgi:hypothetical protein